jgi:thermitase
MRGLFLAIAVLLALVPFLGAPPPSYAKDKPEKDDERIFVKFKAGTPKHVEDAVHLQKGGKVDNEIKGLDVKVIKVGKSNSDKKVQEYQADPNVEYAEPVGIAYPDWAPSDEQYPQQWALNNPGGSGAKLDADIDAPAAWDVTRGGSSTANRRTIAIIDTGVHKDHPDLQGKVVDERNWATTDQSLDDVYGHGTHVAGIAAAVTNTPLSATTPPTSPGVAGVCPDCRIINGKVCFDDGGCPYDRIANGVLWAVSCEERVGDTCVANGGTIRAATINISLTGGFNSRTLQDAIDKAWSRGAVVTCAAGNSGNGTVVYPAGHRNCIAVAATNRMDTRASFSNYGSSWVDVAAPGVGILSTVSPNGYAAWDGTSMASPHVAGVAGLVWATSLCSNNTCVRNHIESNADRITGTGSLWSKGRLNACRAVAGKNC